MNEHKKFAVCTLPRSGSFLASQLLEEYLVRKYNYERIPFYEYLCFTTLKNKEGNMHASIEDGKLVCGPVDYKLQFMDEINNRMELLEQHAAEGKHYLNKIIYRTSPIDTMQYLVRTGHYFCWLERRDIEAQITSYVIAVATQNWHDDPTNRNFNFGLDKKEFAYESVEILEEYIERQVYFLKDMRQYYNWTNHSVVFYEDFKDDYDHLFTSMGLDDYKDYLPDFDFIESKPTKKFDPSEIIGNYDDVVGWIAKYKKEMDL